MITIPVLALLLIYWNRGSMKRIEVERLQNSREVEQTPRRTQISLRKVENVNLDERKTMDHVVPIVDKETLLNPSSFSPVGHADSIGSFPPVIANYRLSVGLKKYMEALSQIGCRFFVLDRHSHKLVAELAGPYYETLVPRPKSFQGLSPRCRELRNESELKGCLLKAREQYGVRDGVVVALIPRTFDSHLISRLTESTEKLGIDMAAVANFEGTYHLDEERLILQIHSIQQKDGQHIPTDVNFDLSSLDSHGWPARGK